MTTRLSNQINKLARWWLFDIWLYEPNSLARPLADKTTNY